MTWKKGLLTILCCAMTATAFSACETIGESSKQPSVQNPSIQTPNTQTPTTPETPVVKTVTVEQWQQIFTALPKVSNVTYEAQCTVRTDEAVIQSVNATKKLAVDKSYLEEYATDESGTVHTETWLSLAENGEYDQYKRDALGELQYTKLTGVTKDFTVGFGLEFSSVAPQVHYNEQLGVYLADSVTVGEKVYLDFAVEFTNGKIVALRYTYAEEDTYYDYSFTFFGYGTTEVISPQIYEIGDTVQDFSLLDCDGNVLQLSEILKVKELVIINFWATWCAPCRSEFPVLQNVATAYADKVEVIAVSTTDTAQAVSEFKAENGYTFAMTGAGEGELDFSFSPIDSIPKTVIINKDGMFVYSYVGSITEFSRWQTVIESYLNGETIEEDERIHF